VNDNGDLLATFTDVHEPRYLSTDSDGRVLVADYIKHSILLLNSDLHLEHVFVNPDSEVKLLCPSQLYYNESTSKLYVLHSSSEGWWSPDIISMFSLQ